MNSEFIKITLAFSLHTCIWYLRVISRWLLYQGCRLNQTFFFKNVCNIVWRVGRAVNTPPHKLGRFVCREVWDPRGDSQAPWSMLGGGEEQAHCSAGRNIQADTMKTAWTSWECMSAISPSPVKTSGLWEMLKKCIFGWAWWCTPAVPVLGRQRQEVPGQSALHRGTLSQPYPTPIKGLYF